ncbi:hypothetical protein PACTADRAFT_66191 [Pachysolen tannophilus NRRL Y-2460]|uniref:peptidylprolyl isomerase n=1 Tax=Pachysolen tannophilus NRRL Y-2460 TaxID=669874 RepID=A0A1E4TZV2_PACTA|nr:hypothetical protein PACTADRAFT_66191 [Pachysolen tannophilus NRRL Y-2460]
MLSLKSFSAWLALLIVVLFSIEVQASAASDKLQIGITQKVPASKCLRKSKPGDVIKMHYQGELQDGTTFDSSYERGQPLEFKLGGGQVIKGWDQGLTNMCIGEKRKLTIPPDLAYGSRGAGGVIPPGATLIFHTELVGIDGYESPEDELSKDEL